MIQYYENIFEISIKMLNLVGSNPLKINWFRFTLFSAFQTFFSYLIVIGFLYNPPTNTDRTIELLRSAFIAIHVYSRYLIKNNRAKICYNFPDNQ